MTPTHAVNQLKTSYTPPTYEWAPACIADAITLDKLNVYRDLLKKALSPRLYEYAYKLLSMVERFLETPESSQPLQKIRVDLGTELAALPAKALDPEEYERMFDYVPWEDEIEMMSQAFEALPTGDVRNACFHLIWYARELTRDREPMTKEFCLAAKKQ